MKRYFVQIQLTLLGNIADRPTLALRIKIVITDTKVHIANRKLKFLTKYCSVVKAVCESFADAACLEYICLHNQIVQVELDDWLGWMTVLCHCYLSFFAFLACLPCLLTNEVHYSVCHGTVVGWADLQVCSEHWAVGQQTMKTCKDADKPSSHARKPAVVVHHIVDAILIWPSKAAP